MYIRGRPGTKRIVLRRIGEDVLESPITIEFAKNGVARVKEGVGSLLADLFDAVEIIEHEDDESQEE